MLLKDAAKEFEFNCKCRKLSDKTIENYSKLISYLLDYLKNKHMVKSYFVPMLVTSKQNNLSCPQTDTTQTEPLPAAAGWGAFLSGGVKNFGSFLAADAV